MLICGLVALLGVGVTYLFTPTYDASMLVQEGSYLALDHAYLWPCDDDLMLLDGYECVEIEDVEGGGGGSGRYSGNIGSGGSGGSGKYKNTNNMKHIVNSNSAGYNQIQERDELY